jgi:hypothetical protein
MRTCRLRRTSTKIVMLKIIKVQRRAKRKISSSKTKMSIITTPLITKGRYLLQLKTISLRSKSLNLFS